MNKKSKILIINKSNLASSIYLILKKRGYKKIYFLNYKDNIRKIENFYKKIKPEYIFLTFADEGGIEYNQKFPVDLMNSEINSLIKFISTSYKYNVKKLIYFASSCVYPKIFNRKLSTDLILSGKLEQSNLHYASSKIMGMNLCDAYNEQYNTNFITVIPSNYFGPYDHFILNYSHVISDLIIKFHDAKINNKKKVIVWGSGKPIRDFIYIDDLAKAAIHIMKNYKLKKPINVSSQHIYSIKQLAYLLKETVKYRGKIIFDKSKIDGMKYKVLDNTELKKIGWKTNSNFKLNLIKTYKGYLNHIYD